MNRRTTLFMMNSETTDAEIMQAAETAASSQNHLNCLLLALAPTLPVSAYGVPPYGGIDIPDNWGDLVSEAKNALKQRVEDVETLLNRASVSGHVGSVLCPSADIKHRVGRWARVSDESVFSDALRTSPTLLREAAYGVLYQSPIGLRLNASTAADTNRVMVAWDSSKAASRAVHVALPYLKSAKEVSIACIDPVMTTEGDGEDPGTDVGAWLSHHGCNVTVSQFPSGGREIARCIQDRATEFGADLVVMGAYGHARMLQAVFGGTTKSMIEQTKLSVLLAH